MKREWSPETPTARKNRELLERVGRISMDCSGGLTFHGHRCADCAEFKTSYMRVWR